MIGQTLFLGGLSKRFGQSVAVRDMSLDIAAGEFVSVLGPSGSGKTTLLTMIAGFESPTSGQIAIGGRDVTRVAPNHRNIGMVFQKYALFPHMTVEQNIAFPLRMRGADRTSISKRVKRVLDLVHLDSLAARYPAQLSGGQQQRVAVARALVFEPPVLLMDEPLGALDKNLRESMQLEIKKLQAQLGATVVYVTHDQDEALTMSDRVAVMADGKLAQLGAPAEIYDRPQTPFVADFIGKMNFMSGEYLGEKDGTCRIRISADVTVAAPAPSTKTLQKGDVVSLAVRPERLSFVEPSSPCAIPGRIEADIFVGASHLYLMRLETYDEPLVQVQMPAFARSGPKHGTAGVAIAAEENAFHVFAGTGL